MSKVHDPNDDAVVMTFINSLQHSQLLLSLRQKGPTIYAHLVDDVGGYVLYVYFRQHDTSAKIAVDTEVQ